MPGSQSLSSAVAQREALKSAWNKKDLKKCKEELGRAKIALTEIQFLPTAEAATHKEVMTPPN